MGSWRVKAAGPLTRDQVAPRPPKERMCSNGGRGAAAVGCCGSCGGSALLWTCECRCGSTKSLYCLYKDLGHRFSRVAGTTKCIRTQPMDTLTRDPCG